MDTITIQPNRLCAVPLRFTRDVDLDRLALENTTTENGNLLVGIYSNLNGSPNELVLDAGGTSLLTAGAKEFTISQRLIGGWYWLVFQHTGPGTVDFFAFVASYGGADLGYTSSTSASKSLWLSAPAAAPSLPALFPSPVTLEAGKPPRALVRML